MKRLAVTRVLASLRDAERRGRLPAVRLSANRYDPYRGRGPIIRSNRPVTYAPICTLHFLLVDPFS